MGEEGAGKEYEKLGVVCRVSRSEGVWLRVCGERGFGCGFGK